MSSSNNDSVLQQEQERGAADNHGSIQNCLKCVMGCLITEQQPISFLPCLHFVCSDDCATKLRIKSEPNLQCTECSAQIKLEDLSRKIIPEEIFLKKKVFTVACDNCISEPPAVAYCDTCSMCLCNRCNSLHPEMKATKDHVAVELTPEEAETQREKLREDESKCKDHNLIRSWYCRICKADICDTCFPDHTGHTTCHIQNEKKTLELLISIAKKLVGKLDRAARETKHFCMKPLSTENPGCKSLKLSIERFIVIGEEVLNNRNDTASIQFLEQFESYILWLWEMDAMFSCGTLSDDESNPRTVALTRQDDVICVLNSASPFGGRDLGVETVNGGTVRPMAMEVAPNVEDLNNEIIRLKAEIAAKDAQLNAARGSPLTNHSRGGGRRRRHICRFCPKQFSFPSGKTVHIQSEHQNKRFRCEYCPKVYKYRSARTAHMKKSHPRSVVQKKKTKTKGVKKGKETTTPRTQRRSSRILRRSLRSTK